MKYTRMLTLLVAATLLAAACGDKDDATPQSQPVDTTAQTPAPEPEPKDDIYQFKVLAGTGDSVPLGNYRGQVIMVLNSATQCGYTSQYTDIESLYEQYRDSGFVVLDFPCNQFGGQAPGTYEEINQFCTDRYHISFPQFAKIDVNGASASPLYVWLKSKKPGNIPWNFTKFIIDRNGEVAYRFDAQTSTMTQVRNAVISLL